MTSILRYKTSILKWIFILISILSMSLYVNGQTKSPIVLVSSYNPDAASVSSYLSDFINAYKEIEPNRNIIVENMNCKALSESPNWAKMMKKILDKYYNYKPRPGIIIFLGQEAITAYLSQTQLPSPHIPAMVAMGSRNTVRFPQQKFNPAQVELDCEDALSLTKQYNIVGGYLYQYDIVKNLGLIKTLYPNIKTVAFLTDNSCGGLCLHSLFREEMNKFKGLKYVLLDGRKNTVYSMITRLSKLDHSTALLLGSWRMDKNEGFFLHNSVYLMKDVRPELPVFSLSTIGVGDWAIGGYTPAYRNTGKDLASDAFHYLNSPNHGSVQLNVLPMNYVFDWKVLNKNNIDVSNISDHITYINQPESIWSKYRNILIGTFIGFLTLAGIIMFLAYLLIKTNRLKNALLVSQAELVEAKDRAEEANKLEKAFVANMSHEIRTPLNAIVGFTNLLVSSEIPEEQKGEFKVIIQQNSDLLLNLINDILDLSRLEVNYIKFNFANEDVVSLCKSTLMTVKAARPSHLEYRFESPISESPQLIDMKRMQQVLINLLTNASKFTKEGCITLSFDVDEINKRLLFAVSDTGCGIPADKRNAIFERFTKLDTYVQGTGLGLSICKITIEKMGGKIWVDPNYTKGACFRFYVPIITKEEADEMNQNSAH